MMHASSFSASQTWGFHEKYIVIAIFTLLLALLYYHLLPKPIHGIPHNSSATRMLLGDIPAMEKESNNNTLAWMINQTQKFSSPICQLFIIPFGKPVVFVSDFHEAQDILMRRKEFDRSDYSIALLGGALENHHINLKTGPAWKKHRELLQSLMAPEFLNNVAGRNIYDSVSRLVTLWEMKTRVAAGKPFAADKDIYYTALDAVLDFALGYGYTSRALTPQIEAVKLMGSQRTHQNSTDEPIEFPVGLIDSGITAILQTSEAIGDVANLGFISLGWWWKKLQHKERKFRGIRRQFFKQQASLSVAKLQNSYGTGDKSWVSSATDVMIQNERTYAEKDGREPMYWSDTMHDEMLGFVIAGHDTTSTTLCWAVKFLADNQRCQDLLRNNLQSTYSVAFTERRTPTYQEIMNGNIPYLDAVIEEILRLSHTFALLERQSTEATTILGHPVPKGTTVFMPMYGPSFTEVGFKIDNTSRSESSRNALRSRGERKWPESNMNDFCPERWLREVGNEKEAFDRTAGPFLAFGLGKRGCFGQKLAYLEMKLVLTLIIWHFELQPCPHKLSSYEDVQGFTRLPKDCYVRPRKIVL